VSNSLFALSLQKLWKVETFFISILQWYNLGLSLHLSPTRFVTIMLDTNVKSRRSISYLLGKLPCSMLSVINLDFLWDYFYCTFLNKLYIYIIIYL
jgi:hypothetical protein